ncbi:MAG: box helicase, partial [Burkholderiaceae bacterium]|nr:box helicase [Burkholderiaceae bacterium]
MGNKRGVQVQLALARLRMLVRQRAVQRADAPRLDVGIGGGGPGQGPWPQPHAPLPVWGLSATLGNTEHAMEVLLGGGPGTLVRGAVPKDITVDTLLPDEPGRFPWGGHLGIQMLDPVVREIENSSTTLVFTNTRSQAEIWYQSLLAARPK